jgi:hypothetical protein
MCNRKEEKDMTIELNQAHVFPLPVRVVPEPWEDLASLLSRTAVQMGYKKVNWLLQPEDIAYRRLTYGVCLLRGEEDYRYLKRLLQLEEETLYRLTFHRFLTRIQAPESGYTSLSGEIQRPLLLEQSSLRLFLSKAATRVCPKCLAEDPAHGILYWNISPLVACLKHGIFLIDRCPACHESIPLLRSALLCCPRCDRGRYCQAPTVAIPDDPLFQASQKQVLINLGVEQGDERRILTGCEEPLLQELLPWQYFRLLDQIQQTLTPLLPEHPLLRKIPVFQTALNHHDYTTSKLSLHEWSVVIATFHFIFASWPDNFFTFLDTFSSLRNKKVTSSVRSEFGSFYKNLYNTNLHDPCFSFLHEAFASYIANGNTGIRTTRKHLVFQGEHSKSFQERSYLTQGQVKKMLKIGPRKLQTFIDQGILRESQKQIGSEDVKGFLFIERSDVEALLLESNDRHLLNPSLAREWRGMLPLITVAVSWLGITDQQVFALTDDGFLAPVRGPKVDKYPIWLFRETEVKQFVASWLLLAERDLHGASDAVSLAQTALLARFSFIEIMRAVCEGRLHLIDKGTEEPLFQRLFLEWAELKGFIDQKRQERRKAFGILTVDDFAACLGVVPGTVQRWIRLGLLAQEKAMIDGRQYILSQKVLDAFRQQYIVSEEAAALLGVHHKTLLLYIKAGKLHPVDGYSLKRVYLFLREEVVSL